MAGRLSARKVTTAKAGKYSDGNNLYLVVSHSGSRKWVLRFTWRGQAKEMGLGSASSVTLSSAREKAASAVRVLEAGQNPIAERKRTGGIPTFGQMADEVVAALSPGIPKSEAPRAVEVDTRHLCRPTPDHARRHCVDRRCPIGSEAHVD